MLPAVMVPNSSEMAPSMTNTSSSPTCRCSGSWAPGAIRVIIARRLLSACSQMLLPRTPGCRSCHGKSLSEMICDNGVLVVLMVCSPGLRRSCRRVTRGVARVNAPGIGLLRLELQILVGRREGVAGDEPEPGFVDAPADAVDEGQLVHRRDHRLLRHELLHAMEQHLALGAIQLAGLLAKQAVDVGVSAVGELAPGDHVGLEPGGGVAEGAADDLHEVLQLLVGDALVERRALERAELGADADTLQIADHRLGRVGRG